MGEPETTAAVGNGGLDTTTCPVCHVAVQFSELVALGNCGHTLCVTCAREGLAFIAEERNVFPIPCPVCRKDLDSQKCLALLNGLPDLHAALELFLVEKTHITKAVYCPNKSCRQVFDWIADSTLEDCPMRVKLTCPFCSTSFCAACRVPWHDGITCEASRWKQAGDPELRKLAEQMKWKPCPDCSVLIEKQDGCDRVICLCECAFCYACGTRYRSREDAACTCGDRNFMQTFVASRLGAYGDIPRKFMKYPKTLADHVRQCFARSTEFRLVCEDAGIHADGYCGGFDRSRFETDLTNFRVERETA
jgi:IBR domain, a half RING-finger domain